MRSRISASEICWLSSAAASLAFCFSRAMFAKPC
jgi:hypothetical protein